MSATFRKIKGNWLLIAGLILLVAWPRLTALNQYVIVDEADRWRWAKDFVSALSRGDWAGTLVGDGYPGIVPVWAESIWVLLEAGRRSLLEGQWIGEPGLYLLFHEWDRPAFLLHQRLPIVLLNTFIVLAIVWAVWRLFGKQVALLSGLLIALDPFYLSDSRVNRAEAVITGLMTLSILALIFYERQRHFRCVLISGVLGGLSFLTKIQALALLPAIALIGLWIHLGHRRGARGQDQQGPEVVKPGQQQDLTSPPPPSPLPSLISFGLGWALAAGLTWFILWPAMWVTPLETINLVYDYTTRKVGAEGVNLFFFGQTYEDADPGPVFYPFVFLMRVTPLTLLGLIGLIIMALKGGLTIWSARLALPGPAPRSYLKSWSARLALPGIALRGYLKSWSARLALPGPSSAKQWSPPHVWPGFTTKAGSDRTKSGLGILVIYILVYALAMTLGSHKQDRYLLPIFPAIDILAALGLFWILDFGFWILDLKKGKSKIPPKAPYGQTASCSEAEQLQSKIQNLKSKIFLLAALVIIQMATALPHHPYYYSYFNPLLGGGQTAVRTMRIGWGEGMDQVGAYLAAKPDSRDLVVSSRFTHNMRGFRGELISLGPDGDWTQADYIVLYIQQVQRHQEPSPGFIDYFQARPPEKIITLGGIDYAWLYPIPFTKPADPLVSVMPNQAALLGYSWEASRRVGEPANHASSSPSASPRLLAEARMRLVWENLGMKDNRVLVARLVSPVAQTEWTSCQPDPAFTHQARTSGAYVESLCAPDMTKLPPGLYTVEFGLAAAPAGDGGALASLNGGTAEVEVFRFPGGWQAAQITPTGAVGDTPERQRLEAIAAASIPAEAHRLDRVYEGRLRLVAYQLEPASPKPGDRVQVSLYWQPVKEVNEALRLVVQLADSRSLALGRLDAALLSAPAGPAEVWPPGEVRATRHRFSLAPDLERPLAARLEVSVLNQAEVFWRATSLAGTELEATVARFTVAPDTWLTPHSLAQVPELQKTGAMWQNGIKLQGYTLSSHRAQPGETLQISLFWEATQSVAENYIVFVHLLDETGQLQTQNDDLPRAGAYPTPWWQPGLIIEDTHPLVLPPNLPTGIYRLAAGLYRPEDGMRVRLAGGEDHLVMGGIEVR